MISLLTKTLAAIALSSALVGATLGQASAQAAPATVTPAADTETGSASGSAEMLLAWPLGFVLFGACFADGDSQTHNPLCQALLDLTAGSTGR
ncbi:hypothetical protein [Nocardia rhizosphaerihabitans]|uniref:Uncharacterized protein n=1 Tax=Nocardia rhizosphaerihabitans TaxID=1691570 RepID=A0ABQ2KV08_9NOCA|nr:hypothetical protein [Nocardia rhizosphaerihabitans]GGN93620.1 hypothetical protein GCM10011610_55740 [Nocardia rhizosphaerihabitans]